MLKNSHIIFSHGKESGPYGVKINAMMDVARNLGINSVSLDYQGMADPQARVEKLVSYAKPLAQPIILVGSSMGSYVSIKASQQLDVCGLFLLAPAVFMPGYESQNMSAMSDSVMIIHGWQDEIVPVANAIRFAKQEGSDLLLLADDHVLRHSLSRICSEFNAFLKRIST